MLPYATEEDENDCLNKLDSDDGHDVHVDCTSNLYLNNDFRDYLHVVLIRFKHVVIPQPISN